MMLLIFLIFSANAIELHTKEANLQVKIPYTFGSHTVNANSLKGSLSYENNQIQKAQFVLDLNDVKSDDEKLKCHLLESMTLEYDKTPFPDQHICDDEDKIDQKYQAFIKYPEIKLSLLEPIKENQKEAKVEWEVRGIKKEEVIILDWSFDQVQNKMTIKSSFDFMRSNFGVIVKKFLFINAGDSMPVVLDMNLEPKK